MNKDSAALLRSLRGPLLLVTLGTLFMIDHAGGVGFGRTWPVLLIVYGMVRLAEYMSAKSA